MIRNSYRPIKPVNRLFCTFSGVYTPHGHRTRSNFEQIQIQILAVEIFDAFKMFICPNAHMCSLALMFNSHASMLRKFVVMFELVQDF